MPLTSVMLHIKSLLDGTKIPGQQALEAYVHPPDPYTNQGPPVAYVWSSAGDEHRESGPRSQPPQNTMGQYNATQPAGWKVLAHSIDVWLTWFNDNSDPRADSAFPSVIDIVMMVLRTCQMPIELIDPLTEVESQLVDLGKDMRWEYRPVRAASQQRMERFDALITAPLEERIRA